MVISFMVQEKTLQQMCCIFKISSKIEYSKLSQNSVDKCFVHGPNYRCTHLSGIPFRSESVLENFIDMICY